MRDCMIDLEAMGVTNSPALIQISAVQFNMFTGEMGATFDRVIDLKSSMDAGLDISPGTIKFWMTDNSVTQECREVVMSKTGDHSPGKERDSLEQVLKDFSAWIKEHKIAYVHGNGTASDNVWIRSSYQACDLPLPFTFREDMCYRTIRTLCKRTGWKYRVPFQGIVHNGIDDAKHQVRVLHKMLEHLNLAKFE